MAFVGAIQLKMFGAQIYVADVVGIGMVRVVGAIMTAIIMAGRTGASVKDVVLRFNPTNLTIQIPVHIEIDPRKGELVGPHPKKLGENLKPMIDRGLRAKLEMQSIVTGQMQVGLDFYPGKPGKTSLTCWLTTFQPFSARRW